MTEAMESLDSVEKDCFSHWDDHKQNFYESLSESPALPIPLRTIFRKQWPFYFLFRASNWKIFSMSVWEISACIIGSYLKNLWFHPTFNLYPLSKVSLLLKLNRLERSTFLFRDLIIYFDWISIDSTEQFCLVADEQYWHFVVVMRCEECTQACKCPYHI